MLNTTSSRELQRSSKGVIDRANKTNEPVIVISKNRPVGAVIGIDLLEKLQKMIHPPRVSKQDE